MLPALLFSLLNNVSADEWPTRWLREYASRQTYRIGGRRWSIERIPDLTNHDDHAIEIRTEGKLALRITSAEMKGSLIQVSPAWYPVGVPVFVVAAHTGNGHGMETRFYAARGTRWVELLRISGEQGGPVFRDFDGDGRLEWVFDNFDYYTHHGDGPDCFEVYKQGANGKVRLWKTLPNPRRKHLGMPRSRYF